MSTKNSRRKDIIKHFSARSEKYDEHLDWVNDEVILDMIIDNLPDKSVEILDLGAGTGAVAKHILKRRDNNDKIVAIDICQNMLEQIDEIRIKTICSDVENLPFEECSFDVVVSRQCLHYVENLDKAFSEVQRVLKTDGIFILAQIVPFDRATASDWKSVIKIRQPLRKWYFTSEEWDAIAKKHSLILQSQSGHVKSASVGKWAEKYGDDRTRRLKYKQKLLSMNEEYKRKYAICEKENDVTFQTFWYIARYSKKDGQWPLMKEEVVRKSIFGMTRGSLNSIALRFTSSNRELNGLAPKASGC